jgi:hypothetical protein
MRDRSKLVAAVAALAVAAFCASKAQAGNAAVPSAEYFSIQMSAGYYMTYTGSDPDAVMLVDDITYCAHLDTCDTEPCCGFWSEDIEGPPAVVGGNPIPGLATYGKAFVRARCIDYCAELWETDSNGAICNHFDCMAHTAHSEIFILNDQYQVTPGDMPPPGSPLAPGGSVPPGLRSTDRYRQIVNEPAEQVIVKGVTGFGMSGWAAETSQSRHYQSPQIVQHGHRVYFGEMMCAGRYHDLKVYIKGRIVLDPTLAPTENVDIGVTQAQ